eukprot:5404954-Prymnesium_polylepis.1
MQLQNIGGSCTWLLSDEAEMELRNADTIPSSSDGRSRVKVLSEEDGTLEIRNPVGRTGLCGRGMLGKWGPNKAAGERCGFDHASPVIADPIVTRYHPDTGQLEMLAVERPDTKQWSIPG